jgi:hypothetical protein
MNGNMMVNPTSEGVKGVLGVKTETPPSPSIQEALEQIRGCFREGTMEEWVGLANQAGLARKQAEELFEKLAGNELFWQDGNDGRTLWRWVKE